MQKSKGYFILRLKLCYLSICSVFYGCVWQSKAVVSWDFRCNCPVILVSVSVLVFGVEVGGFVCPYTSLLMDVCIGRCCGRPNGLIGHLPFRGACVGCIFTVISLGDGIDDYSSRTVVAAR